MKKLFLLSVLMLLPMLASADAVEINEIYYNLIEKAGQAEVTRNPNSYSGSVVIPESVVYEGKNYSVTSIGSGAFDNCSGLTSVTIPNSVTSISDFAFSGCSGLTSVTIGNSVTSIGIYAFSGCSGLTSVTIPNSVTSISDYAFMDCSGLTSLIIPNSVTFIGWCAFANCTGLTSITIPNSVTTLDSYVFEDCTGLTSITIPSSVSSIGNGVLRSCINISSINVDDNNPVYDSRNNCNAIIEKETNKLIAGCVKTVIPNEVTTIGYGAFEGCSTLTSIGIPNNVSTIEWYAFEGCSGLTDITLPDGITTIDRGVFAGCSGLTSFTIPNSVTTIGVNAFSHCSGLTSLIIPNSVTTIEEAAFISCTGLTSITLPNNLTKLESSLFGECDSLASIDIPSSVTFIGPCTFSNCRSLTSITIPNSVTSIDYAAFEGCNNLLTVFSLIEEPFTIYGKGSGSNRVFPTRTFNNGILYVPDESVEKYKATTGWKDFKNIYPIPDSYKHTLTYVVDGVEYKSYKITVGDTITPEAEPTKEGYTFSGWSEIPKTMPDHDVEVTGTFTQVDFNVDDVTYQITDEGTATVKGSDQQGEVTIESTIEINSHIYDVTAIADNAFKDNQEITAVTIPDGVNSIGENAFDGCKNLTVINIGKDVQYIGNHAFANVGAAARTRNGQSSIIVNCHTGSVPQTATDAFENTPIETGMLFVNDYLLDEYKKISPWSSFGKIISFDEAAGINSITIDSNNVRIYDMKGYRLDYPQKSLYIQNGKKFIVK